MKISIGSQELLEYTKLQLEHFFPDGKLYFGKDVKTAFQLSLDRVEYCFKNISVPGYTDDSEAYFYHLHSDQYSQFLWYFSNSLWKISADKCICDKLILLNKFLNGIWCTYKNELPDIFYFMHPVGSVLGNAKYSNFLVVSQNVTVNTSNKLKMGKGLYLATGAKIVGDETIGDNVSIGIDACVYKFQVPSNSLVYRDSYGAIKVISRDVAWAQKYFNVNINSHKC